MSWSNFDDLKKFARKKRTPKKKRPIGWQNTLSGKRKRTADDSVSFVFTGEDGEIEGFSSDDDGEGDKLMVHELDREIRNSNQPVVKRKYKKRQLLSEKCSSAAKDNIRESDNVQDGQQLNSTFSDVNSPCGTHTVLQHVSKKCVEGEVIWTESDHEDIGDSDNGNSERFHTEGPLNLSIMQIECSKGKLSTGEATMKSQHFESTGEAISDFHSDEERISSQESPSATISNPTPTPASPAVVGTPKTASEWLKQVQLESPIQGVESLSPEEKATVMQCDSAKKKKKFVRAGLAEQLQRIVAREKSAQTFWNHRVVNIGKEQHSAPGSSLWNTGCLLVQILSDLPQCSLHLAQCLLFEGNDSPGDPHQRLVHVLFRCETWKDNALQVGALVKIHPPWQKLAVPGSPHPIVLCTYFCERLETLSELPVVDIASVKAEGVIIPRPNGCPLRLARSPQKGFKPSKLLFKDDEDGDIKPAKLASLSLTTAEPTVSKDSISRSNTSILNAIESCGGYCGAAASFIAVVQRVYCKRIQSSRQTQVISGCSLLNKTLKANAVIMNEAEEVRWVFLVQDLHGMFAEIQVPTTCQDFANWHSFIATGEGKTLAFTDVRVLYRTNRTRSPALFDIIHSLWSASLFTEASGDDGGSQIDTQESDIEGTKAPCPPDFSYVLTVQGSSSVGVYQDSEDYGANLLYKPTISRPLRDVQLLNTNKTKRFSTCCKLLYCRFSDTSRSPLKSYIPSYELFVVDSSLQTAGKSSEDSKTSPYERIIGQSSYVMPPQLKDVLNCPGAILSLTDLLCNVEGQQRIVADAYSVIRKGIPDSICISCSSLYEVPIPTAVFDRLACLQPAPLPALTVQSRVGYIYLLEGCVIGVDEESACCWLVCGTCGDPKITPKQGTSSEFFCLSCNDDVESPQTRTHLEVLVRVQSCPNAHVTVKLLQNTINKLLPVSYEDSEQQYDIDAVLGKELGPMDCYVIEHARKNDGTLITSNFTLEEIQLL